MSQSTVTAMELYDRIHAYLTEKLYPFWYARVAAPDGGFTTYFDRNGNPTGQTDKTIVQQTRSLFMLSHAIRNGFGAGKAETLLGPGLDWFFRSFRDAEHDPPRPLDNTSYGHNIEFLWLFLHALSVLGESPQPWKDKLSALARHTVRYGVDPQYGGIFVEGPHDGPARDTQKEFWQQAEALVGLLDSYLLFGDRMYWDAFRKVFDFVWDHMINHEVGSRPDGGLLHRVSQEADPCDLHLHRVSGMKLGRLAGGAREYQVSRLHGDGSRDPLDERGNVEQQVARRAALHLDAVEPADDGRSARVQARFNPGPDGREGVGGLGPPPVQVVFLPRAVAHVVAAGETEHERHGIHAGNAAATLPYHDDQLRLLVDSSLVPGKDDGIPRVHDSAGDLEEHLRLARRLPALQVIAVVVGEGEDLRRPTGSEELDGVEGVHAARPARVAERRAVDLAHVPCAFLHDAERGPAPVLETSVLHDTSRGPPFRGISRKGG